MIIGCFFSVFSRNLSDIDKDGKLDCDEFCIAMHLIDVVKMGQMLPAKLPPELLPNKTRSGSFGTPAASVPQPGEGGSCVVVLPKKKMLNCLHKYWPKIQNALGIIDV